MTAGRTPLRKHRTLVASAPQTRTEIAFRESILKHAADNIERQRSVNSSPPVFAGHDDGQSDEVIRTLQCVQVTGQNDNSPVANGGGRWLL